YLEAQQLLSQGDASASLELLMKRPQGPSYLNIPFFDYYTGKVALMVDREEAKKQLERFLKESRDKEHRKSAYRYLAWYHLLKGEQQAAEAYRQKILSEPVTLTGSDKQALVEAQRGFNSYLIKARLNFDAGRYSNVVQDLKPGIINKHCKEPWEFQEYHYRRARALQELGLRDEAIKSFNESLKYQSPISFSLANSTLQLALLFEEKGNWSKSRDLFKAALVLEDYPFHEGIQQKAKAGLARLP
ncbi:MAG: tetratricopeptide repeat protein, partial [Croceimicrobium sp.]